MGADATSAADYLRHPAVLGDTLLVVADDDVWAAPLAGGRAHRLTDGRTASSHPLPSPDGSWVAYSASEEGHPEVFGMPLDGGTPDRWTHLGAGTSVARAWRSPERLLVATNAGLPFARDSQLIEVGRDLPANLPTGWGTAHEVALDDAGRVLLGRNTTNQGRWKRYRGGTAGHLWLDRDGGGTFTRLLPDLDGDVSSPMLIGGRAWFISDHDGVGNVYSCALDGTDLARHTDHEDFYARFAHTDGQTVVYAAGGDVWRLDPAGDAAPRRVDVRLHSPRTQRSRRFVDPSRWLQSYAVHPKGTHVALRVRGRPFTMPLFEGAPTQHGVRDGVNHRLLAWLGDGERLVVMADTHGEERLEVHRVHDPAAPAAGASGDQDPAAGGESGDDAVPLPAETGGVVRHEALDLGVVLELEPSPTGADVAVTDQMGSLRVVDVEAGTVTEVASSVYGLDHPRWSPDGRWLAWSHRESNWYTASIRLWSADDGRVVEVTDGRHANRAPDWDPGGAYLYWIASSRLQPVPDGVYFDHSFPFPDLVVAAVLAEDGTPPLQQPPHPPGGRPPPSRRLPEPEPNPPAAIDHPTDGEEDEGAGGGGGETAPLGERRQAGRPTVRIDPEGLPERVVRLPFPSGRYRAVTGLRGKVLALAVPLRPPPMSAGPPGEARPPGQLELLTLSTGRHEVLVNAVTSYDVSADRTTMVYAVRRALRAVRAGVKPPDGPPGERTARETGRIDLGRLSVAVSPPAEWRQIFQEAWRLQRELFWHADMSGVDWPAVRDRYLALVDRIASRAELSDLIWEMFGELGTGHAYERGGDLPTPPEAPLGHLGADLAWDGEGWVVQRILRGDPTSPSRRMPLREPGVRVGEGARIRHIGGVPVDAATSPASLLVNRADREVTVGVADPTPREVRVRPLRSEAPLRYADWVVRNRDAVAALTDGRVGYVHIPDMGPGGFAEFHRQYLSEVYREGLVVDVRFNGGGNVSSLLLEKLNGVRIGYQLRRSGALEPHPHHAPAGPLVAITNERCGSDGDIFTHAWKRLGLGPVVGTRTWGGVIGIQPRLAGVDGTVTTQPGFAFWFDDVGFGVENYGTDPTHPVEIAPHDAAAGSDPQLQLAAALAMEALDARGPVPMPDVTAAPALAPPPLPPRSPVDPLPPTGGAGTGPPAELG